MRTVEFSFQIDSSEIILLQEKANRLLGSPDGQKILRELHAFDALAHSDKGWVSPPNGKRAYSTDDYLKHPDRFTVAEFYPAIYFVQDNLLLTSNNAFIHRSRIESQIEKEMPDLYERLQKPDIRVILGDIFKVKGTDIRFLSVRGESNLHLEEIRTRAARQLSQHGILLLFWSKDFEWEAEQLRKPEFAIYATYHAKCEEARSRGQLFAEWGDILYAFGGHAPEGPEIRYKWTIIFPH